ncbi:rhodanese-related sulfurtransferase [Catenulispora sp. GP43]|uniref:hypothetical protein n=1 Tax=Catenulispora sp. GP43 TaxID=3156263 RepID=UPI003513A2A4
MNPDPLADHPDVVHVVSLVLLDAENPGRALFGVRTPTPTSRRHPDVLSSPTMRVPRETLRAALRSEGIDLSLARHGEIRPLTGSKLHEFGTGPSMASHPTFLAEHLMARKLGIAEHLVAGRIRGHAAAGGIALDTVHDDEADPPEELTLMLSIVVTVEAGGNLFPGSTESYSRLDWVPIDDVHEAVLHHDPVRLVPTMDPISVCLHGLCVRSAAAVIESRRSPRPSVPALSAEGSAH